MPERRQNLSRQARNSGLAGIGWKLGQDKGLFDYLVSLRNYLSHNSNGARRKFVKSIKNLNEKVNDPLKANLGQIGPYLKAIVSNNKTRAGFIVRRLQDLANKL